MTEVKIQAMRLGIRDGYFIPILISILTLALAVAILAALKHRRSPSGATSPPTEKNATSGRRAVGVAVSMLSMALVAFLGLAVVDAVVLTVKEWHTYMAPVNGMDGVAYAADEGEVKRAILHDFKVDPIKNAIDGYFKDGNTYARCKPVFSPEEHGVATIHHLQCDGGRDSGGGSGNIYR